MELKELTIEQLMELKKDLEWQLKQVRKEIRIKVYGKKN
jgi:hypothetical protein